MGQIKVHLVPPENANFVVSGFFDQCFESLNRMTSVKVCGRNSVRIEDVDLIVFVSLFNIDLSLLRQALDLKKQILILCPVDTGLTREVSKVISHQQCGNLVKTLHFSNLPDEIASCIHECIEGCSLKRKKDACCV